MTRSTCADDIRTATVFAMVSDDSSHHVLSGKSGKGADGDNLKSSSIYGQRFAILCYPANSCRMPEKATKDQEDAA